MRHATIAAQPASGHQKRGRLRRFAGVLAVAALPFAAYGTCHGIMKLEETRQLEQKIESWRARESFCGNGGLSEAYSEYFEQMARGNKRLAQKIKVEIDAFEQMHAIRKCGKPP